MKKVFVFIIGTAYLTLLSCFTFMPMAQASAQMYDSSKYSFSHNIQEIQFLGHYNKHVSTHCKICYTSKQIIQGMERNTVDTDSNLLELQSFINTFFVLLHKDDYTHSSSPPISESFPPPLELKSHKTVVLRR